MLLGKDLHSNAGDDVACVPERELATVSASRGRVPWHDQAVYVNQNSEDNGNVPRTEVGVGYSGLLALKADHV